MTGTDCKTNGEASLCYRNRTEIMMHRFYERNRSTTRYDVNTESVAKPTSRCCCCCILSNYVVEVLFGYFHYMLEFHVLVFETVFR